MRCCTSCPFSGGSGHSWLVLLLDRRRRPHWRRHRPGAPPRALLSAAQRRCIHRQAGKCRKGRRGCCSMGGELEWTGGVTPGRTCNTRQGLHSTERSFYGIIQQRQHGTARLGQLPLAHTTHSVTQSGLSHLPTHLTYGFGRTHLPNLFGCIYPLYEIRSGIHHAYNMYIARRVVNLA